MSLKIYIVIMDFLKVHGASAYAVWAENKEDAIDRVFAHADCSYRRNDSFIEQTKVYLPEELPFDKYGFCEIVSYIE